MAAVGGSQRRVGGAARLCCAAGGENESGAARPARHGPPLCDMETWSASWRYMLSTWLHNKLASVDLHTPFVRCLQEESFDVERIMAVRPAAAGGGKEYLIK